jgi:hypothetical protein
MLAAMPNMHGQQHPWERAGATQGAWMRMFRRLTGDHVAADHAVEQLFPTYDRPITDFDFDEFRRLSATAKDLQADWWNAINGDGPTVLALIERYGTNPHDDRIGVE